MKKKVIIQLITKSGEVFNKREKFSPFRVESIRFRSGVISFENQVVRDQPNYLIKLYNPDSEYEYVYEVIPYTEMMKIRFIEE